MEKDLTQAVLDYKQNGVGLKEVVDEVAQRIYFYPPMRKRWEEDRCGDFLCYFYPRILKMVTRFEDRGKSFEALLAVTLKWQMRDYAYQMHKKEQREKILSYPMIWDYPGEESPWDRLANIPEEPSETLRKALKIDNAGIILDPSMRRRLLCLLLREVRQVSDSFLTHAALLTGCDQTWLEEKLQQARALAFQREGRSELFQHRRHQALINIYSLHERIRDAADLAESTDLCRQLERESLRLKKAEEGYRRIPRKPSHREIADILGFPKGTVDSGLYYLRSSLSLVAEKSLKMRSSDKEL